MCILTSAPASGCRSEPRIIHSVSISINWCQRYSQSSLTQMNTYNLVEDWRPANPVYGLDISVIDDENGKNASFLRCFVTRFARTRFQTSGKPSRTNER